MKKIISLLLAMLLVFSLATVAFADGEPSQPQIPSVSVGEATTNNTEITTGSITINGVTAENTYAIYKMLHLESYDTTSKVYSYKIITQWLPFFTSEAAHPYVAVDNSGYVTWIGEDTDTAKAAFAKLALAFAKNNANGISAIDTSADGWDTTGTLADGTAYGKFTDLTLGYYLVDSTMGALCGLTTTNEHASISAKNVPPTMEKQVREDSTAQWGSVNTADIGQLVDFRVTINVHRGAENYILHDQFGNGFTFGEDMPDTIQENVGVTAIHHVVPGKTDTLVPESYYDVDENPADGCSFHVEFTQDFCEHLQTNDKVVISYNAMLNRHATIAGAGNQNKAWLSFGELSSHTTEESLTTTKTYAFDLIKTDSQNTLIDGAQFKIYDALTGGNEVGVVPMEVNVNSDAQYRRARPDELAAGMTQPIVVEDGKVRIAGFDNGTYYLEEVVTPNGYNQLAARHAFTISDLNLYATFNGGVYSTGSGVHVVNKAGSMLPETGAMGTSMFIVFGMFVMLGTGVLLVTKKRMSMIED